MPSSTLVPEEELGPGQASGMEGGGGGGGVSLGLGRDVPLCSVLLFLSMRNITCLRVAAHKLGSFCQWRDMQESDWKQVLFLSSSGHPQEA